MNLFLKADSIVLQFAEDKMERVLRVLSTLSINCKKIKSSI